MIHHVTGHPGSIGHRVASQPVIYGQFAGLQGGTYPSGALQTASSTVLPVAGYHHQTYHHGLVPQRSVATPVNSSATLPMTPKVMSLGRGMDGMATASLPLSPLACGPRGLLHTSIAGAVSVGSPSTREQALEQRVSELQALLERKEQDIKDLQAILSKAGLKPPPSSDAKKVIRTRDRAGNGFKRVSESQPLVPYEAMDQDDPVDMRLEEFYNSTGSAIQFRRINRGFYRFGETILELTIINHKLMARTEDGWNRSKFGPIEKFLMYYENIEREKAGMTPEP